jgi:hypothetical protein
MKYRVLDLKHYFQEKNFFYINIKTGIAKFECKLKIDWPDIIFQPILPIFLIIIQFFQRLFYFDKSKTKIQEYILIILFNRKYFQR